MQSSSADTNFTLDDNVIAVAESGTHLHQQQATVELLVERRRTKHLPDAAKAQQVTNQWDVPREEVLRRVDNERQGDLLHDQGHQGQPRTSPRTRETPGKRRSDGPEHFSP